ncbi:MAG: hypothetical protein JKY65_29170 [Planctomycetes bacterium]|nr:hypothetical protein [Planctomycetota bacterium]
MNLATQQVGKALSLALLLASFALPAFGKASGSYMPSKEKGKKAKKVRFKDAIAFWSEKENDLKVVIFPFKLKKNDFESLKSPKAAKGLLAARKAEQGVSLLASFEGAPTKKTLKTFTLVYEEGEEGPLNHMFVNGKENPNWGGPTFKKDVRTLKLRLPVGGRPGNLDLHTKHKGRGKGSRWEVKLINITVLVDNTSDDSSESSGEAPAVEYPAKPKKLAEQGWVTQELGQCAFYNRIVVDAEGRPHVAIAGASGLYVGKEGSEGWTWETVAGGANWLGGPRMDLALDASGVPSLAYYLAEKVFYATRKDDKWSSLAVGESEGQPQWVDMTFDAEGKAHILVHAKKLQLALPKKKGFSLSEVSSGTEGPGSGRALVVDLKGTPHVVYEKDGQLFHAQRLRKKWTETSLGKCTSTPSIAVDSAGRLHVTARNYGDITYRHSTDKGWSDPEVIGKGNTADPVLAVGGDGSVHVAWLGFRDDKLFHARRSADGWKTTEVPFTPKKGACAGWLSLAVGPKGKPHMTLCWQHGTGFDSVMKLRHITRKSE